MSTGLMIKGVLSTFILLIRVGMFNSTVEGVLFNFLSLDEPSSLSKRVSGFFDFFVLVAILQYYSIKDRCFIIRP
ncbi:hypothetical protein C2G38_2119557 [Gigaspora rosea]|uniref:Uncharacterized protein n=1 Tax=Gigaspora rosea TaxID=44941 RepID=A0A397U5K7_9GLOM|nr:hypothetical protein C2G38_2119557 [Gigaspora rosea]